jgi:hypothetical protein
MAGGDWPELARVAALELSAGERRHQDTSTGVKLLAAIRVVWEGERMTCADVADALNGLEDAPYGGWNDGRGISTRELGKHLARYGIRPVQASIQAKKRRFPHRYQRPLYRLPKTAQTRMNSGMYRCTGFTSRFWQRGRPQ